MKRFVDFIFTSLGLFALGPIILLLMLLVRLQFGSPVLLRQTRPGLSCKIFQMCKFRTII